MAKQKDEFLEAVEGLTALVDRLREDLRDALEAVLPQLDGARACARALGLKRGLGWKVYTVATSSELADAIAALPRDAGWNLLFTSLRRARCPPTKLAALEKSARAVQAQLERGGLRRPMLRAIAAGQLDTPLETEAFLRSRRAVREGFEAIYGLRCATQLGLYAIGPADAEGRVSMVANSVMDGLRRLRPGPPVAIKSLARIWQPSGTADAWAQPLGACAKTGWLVPDLSTKDVWDRNLEIKDTGGGPIVYYEAHANDAARGIRTVFAESLPSCGTVGKSDDRVDLQFAICIPTAYSAFEVWVHRSIRRKSEPSAALAGSLDMAHALAHETDLVPLPLEARAYRIESDQCPSAMRGLARTHDEMLRRTAAALSATPDDFDGFRVEVPDPPIGSRIRLRWRM